MGLEHAVKLIEIHILIGSAHITSLYSAAVAGNASRLKLEAIPSFLRKSNDSGRTHIGNKADIHGLQVFHPAQQKIRTVLPPGFFSARQTQHELSVP